jgi:drug/metabolite transporter (DMT)-like permease
LHSENAYSTIRENKGMTKDRVDFTAFAIMFVLTLLWGYNYAAIKYSTVGFSPIFTSFVRSAVASVLGIIYCLIIKEPLFHRDIRLFHGFVVGLLFGVEFVCLYLGMLYTSAARAAVLVYLSPFVVALGAHMFLAERLDRLKTLSLMVAFFGVYLVFQGKPAFHSGAMWIGDALEILAAVFWGITTLYIKKFLAHRVHPIHTFLYQLVFSIPIIFVCALILEPVWVKATSSLVIISVIYQSVVVAFASYLVWFKMVHIYPVGKLSVFTFLAPLFGVASGVLFLGEEATTGLLIGLACVCAGIYGTNYTRAKPADRA